MKSHTLRPKPERKWKPIMTMSPFEGVVKPKDAADERGTTATPNVSSSSVVPPKASMVPVNSERFWMTKTTRVLAAMMRNMSASHAQLLSQ